jgi:hypothetical protein
MQKCTKQSNKSHFLAKAPLIALAAAHIQSDTLAALRKEDIAAPTTILLRVLVLMAAAEQNAVAVGVMVRLVWKGVEGLDSCTFQLS